jgi:putative acetyltransferase
LPESHRTLVNKRDTEQLAHNHLRNTIGMAPAILIRPARFGGKEDDAQLTRSLMREYAAYLNHSVGGEHICIADLETELQGLPGTYAEPEGIILLAFVNDTPAGCVALKPLDSVHPGERACEMKRLWVRPEFQGQKLGRRLAEAAIEAAAAAGYTAIYLSTMPAAMQAAHTIYLSLGFTPVDRDNQTSAPSGIAFLRRSLPALLSPLSS